MLTSSFVQRSSGLHPFRIVCVLMLWMLAFTTAACGKKDVAMDAILSDANGYVCTGCGAKDYTARKSYMEVKCPKCDQYTLADVVGYYCEKDKHVTLRPKVSGPAGAAVCEVCGAELRSAMVSPKEKELLAWGATKAPPQYTH